jgi:hypothetical protein
MDAREVTCFVIMPFGSGQDAEEHKARYRDIVQRALDKLNAELKDSGWSVRTLMANAADRTGRVTDGIIQDLRASDLVIADLKGLNANVMYELGIRHATRHGTIIMAPKGLKIPFDIQDEHVFKYEERSLASAQLQLRLSHYLDALKSDKLPADSPVLKEALDFHERIALGPTARAFADQIADHMTTKTQWAIEVLDQARIGWHTHSLFSDRMRHFREEKEAIAKRFVPFLLHRCFRILQAARYPGRTNERIERVFLIIDSGTTLVPVFRHLAMKAVSAWKDPAQKAWLERIEIVTNNLPGVRELIEYGLADPTSRYSDLAIHCQLLPGAPLPVYSAVAGELTETALAALKDHHRDTAAFIGIWTGNWVRIRRSDPPCPVPMARGKAHHKFKQALVNACDEAYVLAPLGKIFRDMEPDDVNTVLGFSKDAVDPEKQPYAEVDIGREIGATIKLVSTRRSSGCLLRDHAERVQELLRSQTTPSALNAADRPAPEIPHIMDVLEEVPSEERLQMLMEFPHEHTRENLLFLERFGVQLDRQQRKGPAWDASAATGRR